MPKLIKDNCVINDPWQVTPKEATTRPEGPAIIPLHLWNELLEPKETGLWLDSDESPEQIKGDLTSIPVIAINFPAFADGRGFSYGRELREKGFKGELRAIGGFMRDQLFYLKRCGFNAFSLENSDQESALESLNDFTESYQSAIDQEQPLFKRR